MSEVVTFRVGRKLKQRMASLSHINWSELLRNYTENAVSMEESKLAKSIDPQRMDWAIREMNRLAKIASGSQWTGSEEVIKWRKKRYSYSTRASQ